MTHVAIGDSEAWLAQPTGNLLFIKPIEVRASDQHAGCDVAAGWEHRGATNSSYWHEPRQRRPAGSQVASLTGAVPTAMPVSSGAVLSGPVTPFAIQFTYPEDVRQTAIAEARPQHRGLKPISGRPQARLEIDFLSGPRNWRYAAQGSRAIEPADVSDNGRLTAFRFPGNMPRCRPSTRSPPDGQETIVPYTMRGDRRRGVDDGTRVPSPLRR